MSPKRLNILYVSQMPASPPRFGAQARMHGLMTQLARHHDLTAVMLVDDEFDIEESRRAMQVYCRDVALISNPYGRDGVSKRRRGRSKYGAKRPKPGQAGASAKGGKR